MAIDSRSSAAELRPAWVRWLLPSIGDSFFVAQMCVLAFTALSVRLLGDAGIGWHIRTGQMILASHGIPHVDPFSTQAGQPWFAWEWLYDVFAGWLDSVAGLNGVVWFTAVVIAAVFGGTLRLLLRRGVHVVLALVLVLLAASASMVHFLARPHVVSWLFTLIWFWVLDSSGKRNSASLFRSRRMLWFLPLLMLAWVNVHGGFLVGFVLLGIYWCDALWQWTRLKPEKFDDALRKIQAGRRVRVLTRIGLLSAAATLVNPYGFQLHIHIYRYLSNRFLMDHIDEFLSPNFHYVAQKCFAALLLLALVALASKRREVEVSGGLIILFAVYSGLYATRNIPVSSVLLVLVIGPWLSDAVDRFLERRGKVSSENVETDPLFARMQAIDFSLRGHLWPIAAIALTGWIALHGGTLGARQLMDAHFSPKQFPVGAVDYLEKHEADIKIVSTDAWGGYLIYRLYPRVRVVVDDRHDFYGEAFVKSYLKMVRVEPGWDEFLQQHPARFVLAPKKSALANILLETPAWHSTYRDDVAVLFERSDPH
jgi:hypothetical protein